MAYTSQALRQALPILRQLPDGIFFDVSDRRRADGTCLPALELQATSQNDVRALRTALGAAGVRGVWRKSWAPYVKWWEYETEHEGLLIQIYAIKEAPATCRARIERRVVTERVPTEFETRTVEKDVIVGWDCGDDT